MKHIVKRGKSLHYPVRKLKTGRQGHCQVKMKTRDHQPEAQPRDKRGHGKYAKDSWETHESGGETKMRESELSATKASHQFKEAIAVLRKASWVSGIQTSKHLDFMNIESEAMAVIADRSRSKESAYWSSFILFIQTVEQKRAKRWVQQCQQKEHRVLWFSMFTLQLGEGEELKLWGREAESEASFITIFIQQKPLIQITGTDQQVGQ